MPLLSLCKGEASSLWRIASLTASGGFVRRPRHVVCAPVRRLCSSAQGNVRAAIFTVDNVLVRFDTASSHTLEGTVNIPRGSSSRVLQYGGPDGARERWARGEFLPDDPAFLKKYRSDYRRHGRVTVDFDVSVMANALVNRTLTMPDAVVDSLKCLKADGIRLAVITSTGFRNADKETTLPEPSSLFDVIVEPCRHGFGLGDITGYKMVLEQLGVPAEQCVYFDPYMKRNTVVDTLGIKTIPCSRLNFAALLEPLIGYYPRDYFPNTVSVQNSDPISVRTLTPLLQRHLQLPSFSKATVRRYTNQDSLPAFRVGIEQLSLTLRTDPDSTCSSSSLGEDSASVTPGRTLHQDYSLADTLHKAGVPIPQPVVYNGDKSDLGSPYYLIEDVEATDPSSYSEISPEGRKSVYRALCQALADLHSVTVATPGLETLKDNGNDSLAGLLSSLSSEYIAKETHHIAAVEQLHCWLCANIPPVGKRLISLVHGSYRLERVAVNTKATPASVTIPDWRQVTVGDPLVDVADCCLAFRLDSAQPLLYGTGGADAESLGVPSEVEFLKWYQEERSLAPGAMDHWQFYIALSHYKRAVELQAAFHSSVMGDSSVKDGFLAGPAVEYLAEHGLKVTAT